METFGEAVRRLRGPMSLRALAQRAHVDKGLLSKIENGIQHPSAQVAQALDTALSAGGELITMARTIRASRPRRRSARYDPETDWPAFYGERIAHAVSIVDSVTGPQLDAIQDLVHRDVLMINSPEPRGSLSPFEISRRQALITLAALPLAVVGPRGAPAGNSAVESFLSRCCVSLTACWHLLHGSDLDTVSRLLGGYAVQLQMLAAAPSRFQQLAARLASQGHRISGIIALHRNDIGQVGRHERRAVECATLAEDVPSQVAALISLGGAHFYQSDPARAATTYEQALQFDADTSPLLRSRTRADLSVVYAQLGRSREALAAFDHAEELYPRWPEDDPSYLFAGFTPASLALKQGLALLALAQLRPQNGYHHRAASVFARVENAPPTSVPDRTRHEVTNHQAATAVLRKDLDGFEQYITRGAEGAAALASRQRQKEVIAAWRQASQAWPNEARLKALGRRLPAAITARY